MTDEDLDSKARILLDILKGFVEGVPDDEVDVAVFKALDEGKFVGDYTDTVH